MKDLGIPLITKIVISESESFDLTEKFVFYVANGKNADAQELAR